MRKKPTSIPQIEDLLITESTHISKLNEIVLDAIEEEKLLSKKLGEFEDKNPGYGGMLADKVAQFAGSWKFIISFVLIMTAWVAVNTLLFSNAFDPFPFILLNLILSTIAAIQAPIIIMSQNRKEEKDRQRAINDYMVNLKSEIEIRNLHQKLDLLIAKQMSTLFELQNVQVEMMKEIKLLLNNNKGSQASPGKNPA